MNLLTSALLSGSSMIDLDGTVFVQVGIFFVSLILLRSLVFKPVMDVLDAREEAIDGAKAEATRLSDEADSADDNFQAELAKVRKKGAEAREKLRQEGLDAEKSLVTSVQREVDEQLDAAEKKLDEQAKVLRGKLNADVPALANQIASKLLQREVS